MQSISATAIYHIKDQLTSRTSEENLSQIGSVDSLRFDLRRSRNQATCNIPLDIFHDSDCGTFRVDGHLRKERSSLDMVCNHV
jgi:hypothetical protein